jgi:hypothetical protein
VDLDVVPVSGDGTWMPEITEVAVAKLVTDRRVPRSAA